MRPHPLPGTAVQCAHAVRVVSGALTVVLAAHQDFPLSFSLQKEISVLVDDTRCKLLTPLSVRASMPESL